MKIKVIIEQEFIVEFDENNNDFKDVFDCYKQGVDHANYEDMCENIVYHVCNDSTSPECIGSVKLNGNAQKDYSKVPILEINHPINVICDNMGMGWIRYDMTSEVVSDDE